MLVEELLKTSSPDPWVEAIKSDVTAVLRSLPAGTDIDVDQVMARVRHDLLGEPMPAPRKITIHFTDSWEDGDTVMFPPGVHVVKRKKDLTKKAAPTLQEVEAMIPGYLMNHGPQNKSHLGRTYGVHHETLDRILVRLLGEKLVRRNGRLWESAVKTASKKSDIVVPDALAKKILAVTGAVRAKRRKKGAGPSTEMEIRHQLNAHGTLSLDALRSRLKMGSSRTRRVLNSMIRNKIVMRAPTSRGRAYTLVSPPVTSQHVTLTKLVPDATQVASSGI